MNLFPLVCGHHIRPKETILIDTQWSFVRPMCKYVYICVNIYNTYISMYKCMLKKNMHIINKNKSVKIYLFVHPINHQKNSNVCSSKRSVHRRFTLNTTKCFAQESVKYTLYRVQKIHVNSLSKHIRSDWQTSFHMVFGLPNQSSK